MLCGKSPLCPLPWSWEDSYLLPKGWDSTFPWRSPTCSVGTKASSVGVWGHQQGYECAPMVEGWSHLGVAMLEKALPVTCWSWSSTGAQATGKPLGLWRPSGRRGLEWRTRLSSCPTLSTVGTSLLAYGE